MNNRRLQFILAGLGFLILVVIVRLFYIQVVCHDEIAERAKRQHFGIEHIQAERGMIVDRNFCTLALTDPIKAFYVSLSTAHKKRTVKKIAEAFSKITKMPVSYYLNLMNKKDGRACLERISGENSIRLSALRFDGLYVMNEPERFYPYNDLAAHIIGYSEKKTLLGRDGIERTMNDLLVGVDGNRVILRDPMGNMVSVVEESTVPPQTGNTIVLTIDKSIQQFVEDELQAGLERTQSKFVVGIVMNPQTGEILALANKRSYDLNQYNKFGEDVRRNHAVSDLYEPGSTFKALSLASFIDMNSCNESDMVNAESGLYKIGDLEIKDVHASGTLSVRDVFIRSSNIGMSKLAAPVKDESFYKYLRAFGIGIPTAVSLPAEAKGRLSKPSSWHAYSKLFISFGYEVAVTPLQLITAYSAIINGGNLFQPQIVQKIQSTDGTVINDFSPKILRQVISNSTSERMKKLFVSVVNEGTGIGARIPGMSIGGKTGTAQTFVQDSAYAKQIYNASFVGFFPADNPKYVCLILVNAPSVGQYYGGEVAAPIFKSIAEKIINYDQTMLPAAPEQTPSVLIAVASEPNQSGAVSENYAYAQRNLNLNKYSKTIMPDLTGMTIRDAVSILSYLKLSYKQTGIKRILSQSIRPGTRIKAGQSCTISGWDPVKIGNGALAWN